MKKDRKLNKAEEMVLRDLTDKGRKVTIAPPKAGYDLRMGAKFIEVKSKQNYAKSQGRIVLTDNEYQFAKKHKDRYHIYIVDHKTKEIFKQRFDKIQKEFDHRWYHFLFKKQLRDFFGMK